MTIAETLEGLCEFIGDCHRCPLGYTRDKLVFGAGDTSARLMFVGEAPGRNEDRTGIPFVGAAGKFLDELLDSVGLARDHVYIANILKCRPPGNRDPQIVEIDTCTPFLAEQIRLVDPDVIATLGNFATRYVLKTTDRISQLRGESFRVEGRHVVPIFHPAASIYDRTKRQVMLEDFELLRSVLDHARAEGEAAEGEAAEGEPRVFEPGEER